MYISFYVYGLILNCYYVIGRPVGEEIPEAMKKLKPPSEKEKIFGASNDKYNPKNKKEQEKEWNSEQSKNKFEGDMVLPKKLQQAMSSTGVSVRDIISDMNLRWPSKNIPYVFDLSIPEGDPRRGVVSAAIADFNTYTCINLSPRTNEKDYIKFNHGDGCWSYVGKVGGEQEISLGENCGYKGVVLHEILHSLGFFHEHTRLDRDSYIQVNFANIKQGMEFNFQKYSHGQADTNGAPYDYASVMHYPKNAFSIDNNLETITILRSYDGKLGQRDGLSEIDIKQLKSLFQCDDVKPTTPSLSTAAPSTANPSTPGLSTPIPSTAPPTGVGVQITPATQKKISPTKPTHTGIINTQTTPLIIHPTETKVTNNPDLGQGQGQEQGNKPTEKTGQTSIFSTTPSRSPGFTTPIMPAPGIPPPEVHLPKIILPPPVGTSEVRPTQARQPCPQPCLKQCPGYCIQTNAVVPPQSQLQLQVKPGARLQNGLQATVQSNRPCKVFAAKDGMNKCVHVLVGYPSWPNDFHWSSNGIPWNCQCNCVPINVPNDPDGWDNNFLCYRSKLPGKKPTIKWSHQGPIKDMRCIRISEPSDPDSWNNNFLCTPHESPYNFMWSSNGPINKAGVKCLKFDEPNETNEWRDNYLCAEAYP